MIAALAAQPAVGGATPVDELGGGGIDLFDAGDGAARVLEPAGVDVRARAGEAFGDLPPPVHRLTDLGVERTGVLVVGLVPEHFAGERAGGVQLLRRESGRRVVELPAGGLAQPFRRLGRLTAFRRMPLGVNAIRRLSASATNAAGSKRSSAAIAAV